MRERSENRIHLLMTRGSNRLGRGAADRSNGIKPIFHLVCVPRHFKGSGSVVRSSPLGGGLSCTPRSTFSSNQLLTATRLPSSTRSPTPTCGLNPPLVALSIGTIDSGLLSGPPFLPPLGACFVLLLSFKMPRSPSRSGSPIASRSRSVSRSQTPDDIPASKRKR